MVAAANEGAPAASSTPNVRPARCAKTARASSARAVAQTRTAATAKCAPTTNVWMRRRSCDDIRDCAAGEICEDNQCQPQGASCTADRDCARARSAATVAANAGTAPAAATTTVPWVRAAETDNASPRAAVTSACGTGTVLRGRSAKTAAASRKGAARKTETATSVGLAKTGSALTSEAAHVARTLSVRRLRSVSSAPVKPAGPVNRSSVAAAAGTVTAPLPARKCDRLRHLRVGSL